MADFELVTRLADHNQYCVAKRRLFVPLAGLCWIASYALTALVAAVLGFSGPTFQAVLWLAMAGLALDGWWQARAYATRDAHRLALAAGGVAATTEVLAARRAWVRRGLLPSAGPDALRTSLRVLMAAPRLSASAWHAPEDALPWTHGDLARANALLHAIGGRGEDWQAVAQAGEDADLVPGLEALGMLEVQLGEDGVGVRIPPGLWKTHFRRPEAQREVFQVPRG